MNLQETIIPDWITEKQLCEMMQIKRTRAWQLRKDKLVDYTKVNNQIYYSIESVKALFEKGRVKAVLNNRPMHVYKNALTGE